MIRVVQLSLLGSILSNMLLVLGCAFFCGGLICCKKEQVFNKVGAQVSYSEDSFCIFILSFLILSLSQVVMQASAVVNSGLLLMAVMGLVFPAVLHYTHTEVHFGKSELALSRFSSCIMLVAYGAYLVFQLRGQTEQYVPLSEVGYNFLTQSSVCPVRAFCLE